ncbi:hypothetical protein Tco_1114456 [Tanacetum coccineum]|uniref:Uncharacterized protein n=1 Tax=Tanacetum coccineum TaxID=301880 RepID=A0ABQ5IV60_9ASTR
MSDSEESGITYKTVSSPYEDLSDIDYVLGSEEPGHAPPSPDYVPGPEHADDEISDPDADPEEDDDEDPEEDPIDYPADGGDDGDDEMDIEEDEDDYMDIEADEVGRGMTMMRGGTTEPFRGLMSMLPHQPPPPAYRMTARISKSRANLLFQHGLILGERGQTERLNLPPPDGLGIALGPRYKVGESSAAAAARPAGGLRADYGFVATMDREIMRETREDKFGYVVSRFTGMRFVGRLTGSSSLYWIQRVNSLADHKRQRVISDLLETDRKRREEMRELRAADRTRQQQLIQTLTAMQTLQRETIPLQGLVATCRGGPVGGLAQPELPEEAGSSS